MSFSLALVWGFGEGERQCVVNGSAGPLLARGKLLLPLLCGHTPPQTQPKPLSAGSFGDGGRGRVLAPCEELAVLRSQHCLLC